MGRSVSARLFLASVVALLIYAGWQLRSHNSNSRALIKGGQFARPGEYPSTVALTSADGTIFCSGTLLTERLVLTAAHCLKGRASTQLRIHIGNGAEGGRVQADLHEVDSFQIHPGYGSYQEDKSELLDIAWMKLKEPAKGFEAEDFALPLLDWREIGESLQPGNEVRLVGFGCQDHPSPARFPECTLGPKKWADALFIEIAPLRVGVVAKTGIALQGDSGGPAFVKLKNGAWRVIGATATKFDSHSSRDDAAYSLLFPSACWLAESSGAPLPGADAHCAPQVPDPAPLTTDLGAACERPVNARVRASLEILRARIHAANCKELGRAAETLETLDLSATYSFDDSVLAALQKLKELDLSEMQAPPLRAVAGLAKLEKLTLSPYFLREGEIGALRAARPVLRLVAARPVFEAFNAVNTGDDLAFAIAIEGIDNLAVRDEQSRSLLRLVVAGRREAMLRSLLARGTLDVNEVDPQFGHNLLHEAVIVDAPAIARMLLQRGARRNLKNKAGETPLDLARRYQMHELITILSE